MDSDTRQYIMVPTDRAYEALDWLEARGCFVHKDPHEIAQEHEVLYSMLSFKPANVRMTLDDIVISDSDRLLFKLTFGGK